MTTEGRWETLEASSVQPGFPDMLSGVRREMKTAMSW